MRVALGDITPKRPMNLGDLSPCDPSFVGPLTAQQQADCQTRNIQQFFYDQGQVDSQDTVANLQAGVQYRDQLLTQAQSQLNIPPEYLMGGVVLLAILILSSGGSRR